MQQESVCSTRFKARTKLIGYKRPTTAMLPLNYALKFSSGYKNQTYTF